MRDHGTILRSFVRGIGGILNSGPLYIVLDTTSTLNKGATHCSNSLFSDTTSFITISFEGSTRESNFTCKRGACSTRAASRGTLIASYVPLLDSGLSRGCRANKFVPMVSSDSVVSRLSDQGIGGCILFNRKWTVVLGVLSGDSFFYCCHAWSVPCRKR